MAKPSKTKPCSHEWGDWSQLKKTMSGLNIEERFCRACGESDRRLK